MESRFLRNFSWSLFGSIGGSILRVITLVMLSRMITVEDFGVYSIAVLIIGLGRIICDMGMSAAYIQASSERNECLWLVILVNLIIGLIVLKVFSHSGHELIKVLALNIKQKELLLIILCLLIQVIGTGPEAKLQKQLRFKLLSLVDIFSYLICYGIIAISLAYSGFGVLSLIWAILIQSIIKTSVYWVFSKPLESMKFEFEAIKKLFRFGIGLTLGKLANYLVNQGDQILISRYMGLSSIGYYGRAFQLSIMPINLVGQALDKVLFPFMSDLHNKKSDIYSYFCKSIIAVYLITIPLAIIMWFIGERVVILLLGEVWRESATIFPIMAVSIVFRLTNKVTDTYMRSIGLVYIRAVLQWLFLLIITFAFFMSYREGLLELVKYLIFATFVTSSIQMIVLIMYLKGSLWRIIKGVSEMIFLSAPLFLILYFVSHQLVGIENNVLIIIINCCFWSFLTVTSLWVRNSIQIESDLTLILDLIFKRIPHARQE